MKRLTEKLQNGYAIHSEFGLSDPLATNDAIQKLGKYEDIEEDLHADISILYAAKKNGIYRKCADSAMYLSPNEISVYLDHVETSSGKQLYLCDYKCKWALTEEELK